MEKTQQTRKATKTTSTLFIFIIGVLFVLVLSGCDSAHYENPPQPHHTQTTGVNVGQLNTGTYTAHNVFDPLHDLTLKTLQDDLEFETFARRYQNTDVGFGGDGVLRGVPAVMMADMAVEESSSMDSSDGTQSTQSKEFSQTNNQVASVDEADIIKTDGDYIYTTSAKTVFIISAGEHAEILSKIKLEGHPQGLFIIENQLAVFGTSYDSKSSAHFAQKASTFVHMYDTSDKKNPTLTKEFEFEGGYFQARMIKGQMYIITLDGIDTHLPIILEDGISREVLPSDISILPIPYNAPQFSHIHSVNLEEQKITDSHTVAIESASNIYMSEQNLFIISTKRINEWELRQKITEDFTLPLLTTKEQLLIEKIKSVDDEVLSNQEKQGKIRLVIQNHIAQMGEPEEHYDIIEKELKKQLEEYEYFEYTIITKLHTQEGKIIPQNSATIPGSIINQFSLDEHDDVLRIATTLNTQWIMGKRTESSNNVFTLNEDLIVLDKIIGIAQTEQIFSTRFIADKLYMVTFRQIDPFFVIDLSNPLEIEQLGELKIPGFSRYLHPYDETTLIGLGRDATEQGRIKGLKISLFDVSDFSAPKEIAQFVTDERYAHSTAEFEHKAFLFSKEKNLLVIPIYSFSRRDSSQNYNGALVFHVAKDGINARGLIDHSSTNIIYSPSVERSLYIENLLYTKSPQLIRINDLGDLHGVKDIQLKSLEEKEIPIY